ncbi:GNAT family N-acetyltransferase [Parasedimentitalea maritima]|uniref:GNAT family N-acetyltransferase n=1 Tax=Parasedimentitalea maritima TaxID=2578117 RepID=A0A6A4RNN8_9RHOB|nr:GNAT family N-acetyltransferase [Zongyanglinia marina]KAE9632611.1 GNAT family N-acetyltransferase [Zongyanglinia marina]
MSWRLAQDADLDWIQSFLYANLQSSMFLLSNLRDHGLHDKTSDKGMTIWLAQGSAPGIFAITNSGMILLQAPNAVDRMWARARDLIADRPVLTGCLGETRQVRAFLSAAGLSDVPALLNDDEPAFRLNLAELIMPQMQGGELVPLSVVPRELVVHWRASYHFEVMGTSKRKATAVAETDIASYIEKDSHRALLVNNQPVAMTGFNAALPSVVQVGGVYTPPDLRGRGYARLALALHLQEVRAKGVTQSVLFAASTAAVRAYMSLGYQRAGEFSLVLFDTGRKETT